MTEQRILNFDINGQPASKWGIYLGEGSLSQLMTPAPLKSYISNKNAYMHGKQVLPRTPYTDERELTLTLFLVSSSVDEFFANYRDFCNDVLEKGNIDIETRYQPGTVYHCLYAGCSEFSQYDGRMAKFILRLNEPNTKDRTHHD